jgi:hypothetical protein
MTWRGYVDKFDPISRGREAQHARKVSAGWSKRRNSAVDLEVAYHALDLLLMDGCGALRDWVAIFSMIETRDTRLPSVRSSRQLQDTGSTGAKLEERLRLAARLLDGEPVTDVSGRRAI